MKTLLHMLYMHIVSISKENQRGEPICDDSLKLLLEIKYGFE